MTTILQYRVIKTGRVLDTVTLEPGRRPQYDTGAAAPTVEGVLFRTGGKLEALEGWTNGYVQLV